MICVLAYNVVCSKWIVSTRPALRRAQKVKTMNRSQARKSVRSVRRQFVCLFLLHFAPVSKCLFWYTVNRQISLWYVDTVTFFETFEPKVIDP